MPLIKKPKVKYQVKTKEKPVEEVKKKAKSTEDKFFWTRALTGTLAGLLGTTVFHFVGWIMLIWLICWLIPFGFICSFFIFKIPYVKDKWDWKNILKTGFTAYFFLFMLVATICHTLIVLKDPVLNYVNIFANPG